MRLVREEYITIGRMVDTREDAIPNWHLASSPVQLLSSVMLLREYFPSTVGVTGSDPVSRHRLATYLPSQPPTCQHRS